MPTRATYRLETPTTYDIREQDDIFEFNVKFKITNIWKIWGDIKFDYNRKWVMIIKRDDYDLVTFKTPFDPQNKKVSKNSSDKEHFTDEFSQTIIVKNPKIFGYNAPFILRIEPRDTKNPTEPFQPGGNQVNEFFEIPITIQTTYKTLDEGITIAPMFSPSSLQFNNVSDDTKEFKLDIIAKSPNFIGSQIPFITGANLNYSPIIELEIGERFRDIISFTENGSSKISLFTKFFTSFSTQITDLSTSTNVKVRNPQKFGYDENVDIIYRIYSRYFNTQTLVHEEILPLNIQTIFEQQPNVNTGFINTGRQVVLFKGANDQDAQKYNISFTVQNWTSLINTEKDYEIEIRILNDTENLMTILDTGSKILTDEVKETFSIACEVLAPRTFDYDKQLQLQITLNQILPNSTRQRILQEQFPLHVSNKNVQLDPGINVILNNQQIVFSNIHEFRRLVNFNFTVSGIALNENHKFQIDYFDDNDNLFSVFDDDTKTKKFDADTNLSLSVIVTNPTILHYDEDIKLQFQILETVPNSNSQLIIFKKIFPINILTTYSTVKRAIFSGTQDIQISGLTLEPKVIGPEIDNEIFINTSIFEPSVKLTGTEIIFDQAETENKTLKLNISITGLSIGSVRLIVEENDSNLLSFENGLKDITYDIENIGSDISSVDIPILISNPFEEKYQKNVELIYIISDLIDEYSQRFTISVKSEYKFENFEQLFSSKIRSFTDQLKKSTEKLNSELLAQYNEISTITNDQFQTLNESLQNLDLNEIASILNLDQQFKALGDSLTILKHVETNIQEINVDIEKDNLEVFIYDILNNVEIQLNASEFGYSNGKFELSRFLEKGKYVISIRQKPYEIQSISISSIQLIGNYSLISTSTLLNYDISNEVLRTEDGNEFLIIGNSPNSLLVLGEVLSNENGKIIKNLFDSVSYILNVFNYEIDDLGAVFLNKKVTEKLQKNEKLETIYDIDDQTILYKLRTLTDQNKIETRMKE